MDKWEPTGQLGMIRVELVQVGTYVTYDEKSYVVISSRTFQDDSGKAGPFGQTPQICTDYHLCPVSDEGDDISGPDNPTVVVESGQITVI